MSDDTETEIIGLRKAINVAALKAIDAGVPYATLVEWLRSEARYFEFMNPSATLSQQAKALVPD